MTTEEREQLKKRINRADGIETDISNVKELIYILSYTYIEAHRGTEQVAREVWSGIKSLSDQCLKDIIEILNTFCTELNEEYKKI